MILLTGNVIAVLSGQTLASYAWFSNTVENNLLTWHDPSNFALQLLNNFNLLEQQVVRTQEHTQVETFNYYFQGTWFEVTYNPATDAFRCLAAREQLGLADYYAFLRQVRAFYVGVNRPPNSEFYTKMKDLFYILRGRTFVDPHRCSFEWSERFFNIVSEQFFEGESLSDFVNLTASMQQIAVENKCAFRFYLNQNHYFKTNFVFVFDFKEAQDEHSI